MTSRAAGAPLIVLGGALAVLPALAWYSGGAPGGRVATTQNSYKFWGTRTSSSPRPKSV